MAHVDEDPSFFDRERDRLSREITSVGSIRKLCLADADCAVNRALKNFFLLQTC